MKSNLTHNTFVDQKSFHDSLSSINNKLIDNILNANLVLSDNLSTLKNNSYHYISRILLPNNRKEKTLYASLFSSLKKSELMSATSGFINILFSSFLMKELLKNQELLSQNEFKLMRQFESSFTKIKKIISQNSSIISIEDIENEINKVCENDNELTSVVIEAIKLAGLEGKIRVEDNKSLNYVVELKNGFCFKLNPYNNFLKNDTWSESNVKILLVDGILEKVSEMDKLFNRTMETKAPMCIIAHGFSEEILATLKINRDYGVMNIFPVKLFSDLESLNVLNDIAIVCGTDIVSSLKGELVQFVDYDSLPTIPKIKCVKNEFTIENVKTIPIVSNHIKYLLKKREENLAVEDVCTLLDGRIKSLFSHNVIISIPNLTNSKKEFIRTRIDISLRTCKTMLNHGIVSIEDCMRDIESVVETPIDKILFAAFKNAIKHIEEKKVSSLSLFVGVYFGIKTIVPLLCGNGFVELIE